MKVFKNTIIGALLLVSGALFAQQESLVSFYTEHASLYNPAYVGANAQAYISTGIRAQWTGVDHAPETQLLTFGTKVGKNVGIGLSIYRDVTFVEKQTYTSIDFSYKVKVSEKTNLFLGLKAGGNFYDVNTDGLETYNHQVDPSLISVNNFNPNIGIGAILKQKKWMVSLSIPRLLNTDRAKREDGTAYVSTDQTHVYLGSSYDFTLSQNWMLKPSALIVYVPGAPTSMSVTAMLDFKNAMALGASYRTDSAYAGLFSLKLSKKLMVGFAYELSTQADLAKARNTNEIFLKLRF